MATTPKPDSTIVSQLDRQSWNGITVEYGRLETVGEFDFRMPKQAISVAFAPHRQVTWSVDGGLPQTTALPAGSAFIYGDRELVWHRRQQASEYVNLYLDPDWLKATAQENGMPDQMQLGHQVMFNDPTILHVAQLFRTEVHTGGIAGNLYVESLRNLLGIHLIRHYSDLTKPPISSSSVLTGFQVKKLKDYIEENLAEEISIADLAALIPMSQFHFARAFKGAIGESPHRYVTQRRMEQAKVLLSVTALSAAEIAYRVGFLNPSHFTAQFRKWVGTTPKQYRNSCV